MKIIIAPDSFKECLPSRAVASAMAAAAREALAAL
ncbi:MAG: glycerate kinase, partial [Bacteroidales bacterium]|nr:glycerate kinase [Bacteroidales bacterium]